MRSQNEHTRTQNSYQKIRRAAGAAIALDERTPGIQGLVDHLEPGNSESFDRPELEQLHRKAWRGRDWENESDREFVGCIGEYAWENPDYTAVQAKQVEAAAMYGTVFEEFDENWREHLEEKK